MTRKTTVRLDDNAARFVERQVASGGYSSAEEVVQAGLRLLEREQCVAALRAALIEGERGGPPEPYDVDAILRAAHASVDLGE